MYRITQVLSVGPFASAQLAEQLHAAGVTHVLNVSESPNELGVDTHGFQEVAWIPFENISRLPIHLVADALDTLHRMASEPGAHVYIHCVLGHSRSPTVLWLYLIALGLSPDDARTWIEERSPVASPGHRRMVDSEHILFAQMHGLKHFFPHPRPDIIVPFEIT